MVAHPHPNRAVRISYLAMGFACLGLGLVGIFVPLMPTTVFILLAGFFFARSSERWHAWILDHPRFGGLVRDYQAGLGIPMRAKMVAVVAVIVAFAISVGLIVDAPVWQIPLSVLGSAIVVFILTRPTREQTLAEKVAERT
ncbi:MAG: YbaN family protein [Acidimicrobiia bacterium]|nr:YbaN family protein [Acidimicrobiia bacterium]MDH3470198.1 YbaN family protein [Acidimicrobiia bacterium]